MDTPTPTPVTSESAAPMMPAVAMKPERTDKQKQASWGAIIVIVLILAMIVTGAFYAWGHRISQTQTVPVTSGTSY